MLTALAIAAQIAAGWPWVGAAQPQAHVLTVGRPTVIRTNWLKRPVTVTIAQGLVPGCHSINWLHGAAADRQDRCRRLAAISIRVAGRPMSLSSSGYADLGGINDVVVRTTPNRLILYMRGPDGPDYYGATLEFDGQDIVRRQLDLGDGGREVTSYQRGAGTGL